MLYCPKTIVQSSRVYSAILDEMCMHERMNGICDRNCDSCIVKNQVEGTKWLRSMGIRINVIWKGSLLPNAISRVIILSRIKKYYRGYSHPAVVAYTIILTAICIIHVIRQVLPV